MKYFQILPRTLATFTLIVFAVFGVGYTLSVYAASVVGDINGDNTVNSADLTQILSKYGTGDVASDINKNGKVDVFDMSILLSRLDTVTTPPPAADKLTWAPPDTTGWKIVNVDPGVGGNFTYGDANNLTTINDSVIFKMPKYSVGRMFIHDIANMVIVGGQVDHVPSNPINATGRRAIYLKHITGSTIHLEGLLITHENGTTYTKQGDAIAINDAPNAMVTIENVRVPMIYGMQDGVSSSSDTGSDHGDVVQVFDTGSVGGMRIDKFSWGTMYQGGPMFWGATVGSLHVKRMDGFYDASLAKTPPWTNEGGSFISLGKLNSGVIFENVYAREMRFLPAVVTSASGAGYMIADGGGFNTWKGNDTYHPAINGGTSPAIKYDPNAPVYVPEGVAGFNYKSPGYQ